MAHDVFISHSSKDKTIADAVCASLEGRGIRCWIAPRDVPPGKDWGEAIIEGLEGSRIMILVFSSHANESVNVPKEVERAINKGLTVIPFRVEDVPLSKTLEYHLSSVHWLDALTPPLERHLCDLADKVSLSLGQPRGTRPATSHVDTVKNPVAGESLLLVERSYRERLSAEQARTVSTAAPSEEQQHPTTPPQSLTPASVAQPDGSAERAQPPRARVGGSANVASTPDGARIGEPYGGGILAYILQPGDPGYIGGETHGLIAATRDEDDRPCIQWATQQNWGRFVPGVLGMAIGTGANNTDAIIAQNGPGTACAASLARARYDGGPSDWHLPSKDELNKLYLSRDVIGGFCTTPGSCSYWSSSEDEEYPNNAWCQYFANGGQGTNGKSRTYRVRAVRAF